MNSQKILEDARNDLDQHNIENYEQLKYAIESKKLERDIAGARFQKITTLVTSFTTLVTVVVLVASSGLTSMKSSRADLKYHIEVLERDKKNSRGRTSK